MSTIFGHSNIICPYFRGYVYSGLSLFCGACPYFCGACPYFCGPVPIYVGPVPIFVGLSLFMWGLSLFLWACPYLCGACPFFVGPVPIYLSLFCGACLLIVLPTGSSWTHHPHLYVVSPFLVLITIVSIYSVRLSASLLTWLSFLKIVAIVFVIILGMWKLIQRGELSKIT